MAGKKRKRQQRRQQAERITVGIVGLEGESDPSGEFVVRVVETKVFDLTVKASCRGEAETLARVSSGETSYFRTISTLRDVAVVAKINPV